MEELEARVVEADETRVVAFDGSCREAGRQGERICGREERSRVQSCAKANLRTGTCGERGGRCVSHRGQGELEAEFLSLTPSLLSPPSSCPSVFVIYFTRALKGPRHVPTLLQCALTTKPEPAS